MSAGARFLGRAQIRPGRAIIVSGPSGVGKDTIIDRLMASRPRLVRCITCTTRPPRPGERDGVDYHFLSEGEFAAHVADGGFLEHVVYAGHSYGTLRSELERQVQAGHDVVLRVDVKGMRSLREQIPGALRIFIAPPSLEALEQRLAARGTDGAEKTRQRLDEARAEMAAQGEYSHVVVNDDLDRSVEEMGALLSAPPVPSSEPPVLDVDDAWSLFAQERIAHPEGDPLGADGARPMSRRLAAQG
jgi:guanylate kinase